MILLADENFPRPAVEALRQAGLDVLWIAESNPGAPDYEVLALAVSTGRTLLTFDKDFGELAYRRRLPAPCGIVLFRLTPQSPDEAASIALSAIQSQKSWAGHFSVITRQRIRMRPFPGRGIDQPDSPTET
jgi:predicted nuclease of predicted toxin-antitoxin system